MKIRIRTKLAAALAIPLLALVAITVFEADQASDDAEQVRTETELATVSIGPTSLTSELQNERNYTALDLIGVAESATLGVDSLEEARQNVDTAIAELEMFLIGEGPVVQDAFAPAFDAVEKNLAATRAIYDDDEAEKNLGNEETANQVFGNFTAMTTAFFDATSSIATEVDNQSLRNGIEIVDSANRRGELLARVVRNIMLDTLTDGGEAEFQAEVAADASRVYALEERIEVLSGGAYDGLYDSTLDQSWDVTTKDYFDAYLAGDEVDLIALLESVSGGGGDDFTSASEMATAILTQQADQLTSDANQRRDQFVFIAILVVALAIIASYIAARSITRPLRKLRDAAEEMAAERLPGAVGRILDTPLGEDVQIPDLDPIVVKTRDEVGEVVEVLNDVQERTLSLAADQAVLRRNIADSFVNLGRRNQNLLDRQLDFITELESSETDPETLESLFRLDHLATRMRRNSESLLVLAGADSPRQWAAPIPVDDVLRAALGEVENYQRVDLRHLDPVLVSGSAASSVSHVIAELIENALHYSPPTTQVEVKGKKSGGGYVLAIEDDGIGMEPEDIERANRRLSGTESYTVAPSRYLGHYVAGNLAIRLGLEVRVQDSPAGGVMATVTIPAALVETVNKDGEAPAEPEAFGTQQLGTDDADGSSEDLSWLVEEPEYRTGDDGHAEPDPVAGDAAAQESGADWQHEDDWSEEPSAAVAHHDPSSGYAPETLAEALSGFDELGTTEQNGNGSQGSDEVSAEPPTPGGLPRRVPGAQRPDTEPVLARGPATEVADDVAPADSGAFGFLSAFGGAVNTDADSPADESSDQENTEQ